jgi:hypothetical protein
MAKQIKEPQTYTVGLSSMEYTRPTAKENLGYRWVTFGEDDNYYKKLIEMYNQSALHGAAVNGVAKMIYGEGLAFQGLNVIEIAKAKKLLSQKMARKFVFDRKLFGHSYLMVTTNIFGTEIVRVDHVPSNYVRPEVVKVGEEVCAYYVSPDFGNYRKSFNRPERFEAWPIENEGKVEAGRYIIACQPYTVGNWYISPPDYQGAITYIETDVEVGIYHLNNVKTGFSGAHVIQWKNGVPSPETQREIETKFNAKFTGSAANKVVHMFGNPGTEMAQIDTLTMSDADKQYQALATEIEKQIFVAHNITTPLLFGIRGSSGFSSNADELMQGYLIFQNEVISKYQSEIEETFDIIMKFNASGVKVTFVPTDIAKIFANVEGLQPKAATVALESKEDGTPLMVNDNIKKLSGREYQGLMRIIKRFNKGELNKAQASMFIKAGYGLTEEEIEILLIEDHEDEEVPAVTLSADKIDMTDKDGEEWLEYLADKGETIDLNEWELLSETEVSDPETEQEFLNGQFNFYNEYANPTTKSKADSGLFKVRYSYSKNISKDSRDFCKRMVSLSQQGVIYRFEDINAMSADGVNGQFAPAGKSNYSIFKYKGGCYCHHFWTRQIYFRKTKGGKFLPASETKEMENDKRVGDNPFVKQKGIEGIATKDLPNGGSLKNK